MNVGMGKDQNAFAQQAQHIWSMLDEMADSNPDGYKKFIDKQLSEGKEAMALPEPHMCLQTTITEPKNIKLFINVCSWTKIPDPKSEEEQIKIAGSPIDIKQQKSGPVAITAVAFAPKILEDCGRNAKNPAERTLLIEGALNSIEQARGVKLSRDFTVLSTDTLYKGDLKTIQQCFLKKSDGSEDDIKQKLLSMENKMQAGDRDSLLSQLANISVNDRFSEPEPKQSEIRLTNEQPIKSGLIQEISSKTTKLPSPKYEVKVTEMGSECLEYIVVTITLPEVESVKECELDISEDDVALYVPNLYEVQIKLPKRICDAAARAKFNKKTACLTITMPTEQNEQ